MQTSISLPLLHPCLLASLPTLSSTASPLKEDVATSVQSEFSGMSTCCRNSTRGLPRYCMHHRLPAWSPAYIPSSSSASSSACLSPVHRALVELGSQRLNIAPVSLQFKISGKSWRRRRSSCGTLRRTRMPSPYTRRSPSCLPLRQSREWRGTHHTQCTSPPSPPRRTHPYLTEWHMLYPTQDLLMELMLPPSNAAWPHALPPRHRPRSLPCFAVILGRIGARALSDAPRSSCAHRWTEPRLSSNPRCPCTPGTHRAAHEVSAHSEVEPVVRPGPTHHSPLHVSSQVWATLSTHDTSY